jgi:hypothetical protein
VVASSDFASPAASVIREGSDPPSELLSPAAVVAPAPPSGPVFMSQDE